MLERLQKVLARAGFGSRKRCEELILKGLVQVNGKTITKLGTKVDPETDKIKCMGISAKPQRLIYLLFNKPKGVICSTRDEKGRKTIMQFIPARFRERIYPVGRLDKDSEGLLILTNDGELCNLLTHPRYGVEKRYHVILRGILNNDIKEKIQKGVWLSEGRTAPCIIKVKKSLKKLTILEITIKEGLNREIRRIFAKFKLKVKRLKRIRIGPISLSNLSRGAYQILSPIDVQRLKSYVLKGETR